MTDTSMIEIASDQLTAAINPFGAELSHLQDSGGRELMTDADPAFWTGRSPLLFPIVGRLAGDRYRLDGREYPLPQHGFARRQAFQITAHEPGHAAFRLTDNDATRAVYPFRFTLDAKYTLHDATLAIDVTVTNKDDRPMPASFGFHPGFAWPLPFGSPREMHRILFDRAEAGDLARIAPGGLIAAHTSPSPVQGRALPLSDALFAHDALVWQSLDSSRLRYDGGSGPGLEIGFAGMPKLGIWTKPGARLVCVEPWHGIADPEGFTGEIWDKPGMLRFEPGEARTFSMQVTLAA